MTHATSTRTLFKLAYRAARQAAKGLGDDHQRPTAWQVATQVEFQLIDEMGVPCQCVLDNQAHQGGTSIFDAVLWAWHWAHGKQRADLPLWASERRYGFVLNTVESGKENEFWYGKPALP